MIKRSAEIIIIVVTVTLAAATYGSACAALCGTIGGLYLLTTPRP
ncbi:hypothetical protein NFHSH190041_37030 (plasmid) [Shewanella sp. NFH-SH190041]|nr:hypothetical protein [Shewanella sp. NFH-SH190041]BDM66251.1 hypothetical protein NFHSH190041_37030 [Shewanella sp. NFH-SH190041]